MTMDPAHDDAQRDFERRALGNVAALARRLGYADTLDRHAERLIIATIGVVAVLAVSAVAISIMWSKPDPAIAERKRCELDAAVSVMQDKRTELKARDPRLTQAQLERLVPVARSDVRAEAEKRCAGGR